MGIIQQKAAPQKVKGVADIVFCIDCTGSMTPFLDAVKERAKDFLTHLATGGNDQEIPVDWRIKVVGYRDADSDGAGWIVGLDNPFVNDPGAARRQIDALVASGGGDEPESLLDALYVILRHGRDHAEWRNPVRRVIAVFTDATSKDQMSVATVEPGEARDVQHVLNHLLAERVKLFYYGPECAVTKRLAELPKSFCDFCENLGDGMASIDWSQKLAFLRATLSTDSAPVASPSGPAA